MLCEKLFHFRGLNPLVLGLSPDAVPMACLIARYLKGEADVLLVEKAASPENPHFALGAMAEGDLFTYAPGCESMWVPLHFLEEEKHKLSHSLSERRKLYTPHRERLSPANRIVILVSDAAHSGLSLLAAYQAVDGGHPAQVVISVPAATSPALELLRHETEEAFALWTSEHWTCDSEVFEINTHLDENDAAFFLQPLDPDLCISRGRDSYIPE